MTVKHTLPEPISPTVAAVPRELASADIHSNCSNNAAVSVDRVGVQVQRSYLTLSRSGYHFQSVDYRERGITIGFDSHIVSGSSDETTDDPPVVIHGIVGIFKLEQFSYILVITDSQCRGSICNQDIYEVLAVSALPLDYSGGKAACKKIIHAQQTANVRTQSDASASRSQELSADVSAKGSASNAKWVPSQITRIFSAGRASTAGSADLEAHKSSGDAAASIDGATPKATGDTDKNSAVCAQHLIREIDRVGRQILVNLVEHKGRESVVGSAYASVVGHCVSNELIDARMVRYIPWDFHHETRGMHYEKLYQFVEQLQREISDMGYFWYSDDNDLTLQQGVFRINCMDCLDRTNVVQSTIARAVLNEQLVRMGVHAAPDQGLAVYPKLESILSHLWANNGDYISRQYAGTSAMKGDFTRTGRRNFSGVVNDATYSLARLWINTFRDYFSQSVLDFIVGNHQAATVFRTLIELRSHEPGHIQQIVQANEAKVRGSVSAAVGSGESVKLACMVQSPMELDTLKLGNAVDSVLIVTDAAVYVCGSSSSQHEQSSVSIELSALTSVQYGAYITETRTPQGLDPAYNHGIVLKFDLASTQQAGAIVTASMKDASCTSSHFIACKVTSEAQVVMQHANESTNSPLSASTKDTALVRMERLENQTPNLLTEHICSTILSQKLVTSATDQFITDSPIISAAAAKQGVSLVDKMASQLHYAFWV
ncbi:hypothetical protein EV183_002440 [Coemansia sp. RSA 2336]|nr:hypothetical protein EV183_002440 [Coemansia sp. RSA 2336]